MKTNKYKWTTARGANTELTVTTEISSTEIINADGQKIEVKRNMPEYTYKFSLVINGEQKNAEHIYYGSHNCLQTGVVNGQPMLMLIPDEIWAEITKEESEMKDKAFKAEMEAENKYEAHRKEMKKAMEEF